MVKLITPQKDRIQFLDALRGIAILGILVANIYYFSGLFFMDPAEQYPWAASSWDMPFDFVLYTLVDGKFYSIFSLLFGIGCAIQYHSLQKLEHPFVPFFTRRMFWLFVIGMCHLTFIWLGDILTLYAVLGFVLMHFVHTTNKNLLKYAIILLLLPLVNDFVINHIGWNYPKHFFKMNQAVATYFDIPMREFGEVKTTNMNHYLKNEDWGVFFKANLSNVFIRIGYLLEEGRPFKVLGIFLIGLWSGRAILHNNLLTNTKLLRKIALLGITIGLPICFLRTYIDFFGYELPYASTLKTLTYALGTVPLALGYAAVLALLHQKKATLFRWFEPVGKMALTNYIMQSFLAIGFFYGIGLGFAGKFGAIAIFGIALLIYTVQIIGSNLWLQRFKQGPFEGLWRKLTYKK
ncbi:DUF418 domain-containing protein [Flavobacterium sp. UBA6135]|uniref:DUF418 domain-containing protein n=1 Tax=Flavobacterium sp. UBA6135 TaxID=1946553 RepID=UPI0025B97A41|nr:DUF418 domain-containing protein [Flavobacterium sp. UBA6135]